MNANELRKRFPNASPGFIAANANATAPAADLPAGGAGAVAVVECAVAGARVAAGQGEARPAGRLLVRVTSVRRRLLDEDNLCEKFHVDCLRHAGIIPGDAPSQIRLETTQRKAEPGEEEVVVMEVFQEDGDGEEGETIRQGEGET